jgi:hypothetical protein
MLHPDLRRCRPEEVRHRHPRPELRTIIIFPASRRAVFDLNQERLALSLDRAAAIYRCHHVSECEDFARFWHGKQHYGRYQLGGDGGCHYQRERLHKKRGRGKTLHLSTGRTENI